MVMQQWALPVLCRISFLAGKYFICGKKIFQVVASQELKLRPFDTLWNPFEKTGYLVYIFNNAITGACVAPSVSKSCQSLPLMLAVLAV
jgi:hypothetical protein